MLQFLYGSVVQLVRTLACHARGRRFDPDPSRQFAAMAQLAEHVLGKDEVTRSNRVSSSKKSRLALRLSGIFDIHLLGEIDVPLF